jgi:hypothetical protein
MLLAIIDPIIELEVVHAACSGFAMAKPRLLTTLQPRMQLCISYKLGVKRSA